MADFEKAVALVMASEGGAKFTDDPKDRGGKTRYGISKRRYPDEDIQNLTEARARFLYKRDYWDRICGDSIIHQETAEVIFDTCVNFGVSAGSKLVQKILGVVVDGWIGPKTIAALNAVAQPNDFLKSLALMKISRYTMICTKYREQQRFLMGWIKRALRGCQI